MSKVKKLLFFISDKKMTAGAAALILGGTSLLSNFLGMERDSVLASLFGTEDATMGVYQGAFRLPDLIFNLIVLGALSSAFMPIFIDRLVKNEEKAWKYANNAMNFMLVTSIFFGLVIFIFAPRLIPFIMPGYFWDASSRLTDEFETAVNLTRILTLSPILFAISSILTGILQSFKKFFYTSLVPIIYNLSIIIFTIILHGKYGIYSPVIGVIFGILAGIAIQIYSAFKTGFRWNAFLDLKNGDISQTLKLMTPRVIAVGAGQLNLLVDTIVASFIIGGVAVLTFANNIGTLPTVVFGVSIATAVFPFLAESNSKADNRDFLSVFSWGARRILFFIIPATIGLIVLRAQVVRLVYGPDFFNKHAFSWQDTEQTARTLAFFCLGLIAQALIPLLLKAFYAKEDTKTPLKIGISVMILNAILSVFLGLNNFLNLGVSGIALAFSVASFANVALLFYYLHKKIGALDKDHKIFDSTFRLAVSSIIMGGVCYYSLYFFDFFLDSQRVVGLALQTIFAITISAIAYFLLTYLLRCEEIDFVLSKIDRVKSFLPISKGAAND